MTTSQTLKTIRQMLGISQAKLAAMIGQKRQAITNWENGRDIEHNRLNNIVESVNLTWIEILTFKSLRETK